MSGSRHDDAWDSPGFLLWHATLRWQRAMADALAPYDITHVQFVLLASTWWLCEHGGPPRQRDLADHAGTDPMMTSQVVRALADKGLLVREVDPDDRRAWRVSPTAEGTALARRAVAAVESADTAYFDQVRARSRSALLAALKELGGRRD
ncbi:MAG: MarR family transcriptional regulator [Candidatus Nanopelagicales bacterium]